MPFKIVKISNTSLSKLCIIPSSWENQGILKHPRKQSESKLMKDGNSKPHTSWATMVCQVKRSGLMTYDQAEKELEAMIFNDDIIGEDNAIREPEVIECTGEDPLDTHHRNTLMPTPLIKKETELSLFDIENEISAPSRSNIEKVLETVKSNQDILINLCQVQNSITENQNKLVQQLDAIVNTQKQMSNRIDNLTTQIEDITKVFSTVRDSTDVSLSDDTDLEHPLRLLPIDDLQSLEQLELYLTKPTNKNKLIQQYSILFSVAAGKGVTCAYKLLDTLFTREFLCKNSWSGGTRGEGTKIAFKNYKNVRKFFLDMVHTWDPTYTNEENDHFLKSVIRNAAKRKDLRNMRESTKRNRMSKKARFDTGVEIEQLTKMDSQEI